MLYALDLGIEESTCKVAAGTIEQARVLCCIALRAVDHPLAHLLVVACKQASHSVTTGSVVGVRSTGPRSLYTVFDVGWTGHTC